MASVLVVNFATPAFRLTTPPAGVVPSMVQAPEPVRVLPVPVTVAVNVTAWFGDDGFSDDVIVVLLALRTVCTSVGLVLAAKVLSPLYLATMLCEPVVSVVVV